MAVFAVSSTAGCAITTTTEQLGVDLQQPIVLIESCEWSGNMRPTPGWQISGKAVNPNDQAVNMSFKAALEVDGVTHSSGYSAHVSDVPPGGTASFEGAVVVVEGSTDADRATACRITDVLMSEAG